MRDYLPELLALPLYPLLSWQGKRTRRITPRLPEAPGERQGRALPADASDLSQKPPLRLVCIGESPVAGVGVASQQEAIGAQLAQALAGRLAQAVEWQAWGRNGADLSQALQELLPAIPAGRADIVLVAFGVNDSTAFRSSARYRRELQQLLQEVQIKLQPGLIVVVGVPPLHLFPALPQPLRFVLGMKARALDHAARRVAASLPGVCYSHMQLDAQDPLLMAPDGYHPSAPGVVRWAEHLLGGIGDIYVEIAAKK
jgi:lysophospholipase L1-like esterase